MEVDIEDYEACVGSGKVFTSEEDCSLDLLTRARSHRGFCWGCVGILGKIVEGNVFTRCRPNEVDVKFRASGAGESEFRGRDRRGMHLEITSHY